ncbi:MAG: class I SAM-dependent methyltransferase [Anaerolineae bacterium]
MQDDISDIRAFYDTNPLRENERLEENQLEFDMTWRYLMETLPPAGRLLELGAASGRYTLPLAKKGHRLTAVDMSAELLKIARAAAERDGLAEKITFCTGEARDLGFLDGNQYDAALVMGPLYHLVYKADRLRVLRQVYELLKPGAPVISTFITRTGIWGELLATGPEIIEDKDEVEWTLREGRDPPDYPPGYFRAYFCRPEEIAPLHEEAGFRTRLVAALEPCISADDASYNRLEGARRRAWLDLFMRLSTEPSMLGSSRHILYIGFKPQGLIQSRRT